MKKNIYLLFFILFLGVFSCSKNGDDLKEIEPEVPVIDVDKAIIGTWKYTTYEYVSNDTSKEPATGTLVIRNDGTFTMTGDLIGYKGLISYYDEKYSVTEVEGTYNFYNKEDFSFHIDAKKYPNLITRNNVPTSMSDNGKTMKLTHKWTQGSFIFSESWYFTKN